MVENNKEILNIVITGGPCGGKTTALDSLAKLLRSMGYVVYICPETATELINSGIKPYGEHRLDPIDFQEIVTETQNDKEKTRRKAARRCPHDKVAILYDRGLLDGRAYVSKEEYQMILDKLGLKESEILASYDLVIHMVTAAIGKVSAYTTSNNKARTETVEEAKEKDNAVMESYSNHPNFFIVNNDCNFDEKIERVCNIIRAFIGENSVIKREKYLLELEDIDFEICGNNMLEEYIEEFVKKENDDEDEVYTKSTINEYSYFTYTKNRFLPDGSKVSTCKTISKEEYVYELERINKKPIHKTRYNFIDKGERYRLDFCDIDGEYIYILERDVSNINKTPLPYFIHNGVDITKNRNYDDDNMYIDRNAKQLIKQ